jgi:hypothetical protein
LAMDLFFDASAAAAASAASASVPVASADAADDTEVVAPPSLAETLKRLPNVSSNVPAVVERGFEIPGITGADAIPELGGFKRLATDVVVNAVWMAVAWAREERGSCISFEAPYTGWPMDFILIPGGSEEIEENKFKWAVNMSAKVERLRDFVGLENMNIMRIVAASADIVKAKLVSGKKANAGIVHAWFTENVHQGAFHYPDLGTLERHMKNWTAIQKNSRTFGNHRIRCRALGAEQSLGLADGARDDRRKD